MSRRNGTFTLEDCEVVHETDDAILINPRDGENEIWLPLSQVEQITRNGDRATIVMTAWIAKQKGLA